MLRFSRRGHLPLIHQTEAAECGLACLAMVASYHGNRVDLNTLRRRHPASLKGVTLRGLMQTAGHLQMTCRPIRLELEHLRQIQLPAILHWDMCHFVVLKGVTKQGLTIHDPASGERSYTFAAASKHISGVALELSPTEAFQQRDERARLPLSVFWSHLSGSTHALLQILVLSAVLQVLLLAAPFYMQVTIDEVITRGDLDLLVVLALGFGLLMLIQVATTALRSWVLLVLQNVVHFHLGARLFHHLIRLPTAFFEQRHTGDVLSRFTSLQPIRNLLTEGMITALIDGIMAVLTLAMIFLYSPPLALLVLGALALYAIIRLSLYGVLWRRTQATIEASAQESSTFIETLRAIQCLKLFNRESERESQWLNRYAEVANSSVSLGRAKIAFSTINDLIFGLELIIIVFLAARLVLAGNLTVGMVFAFMAYRQHFIERSVALVEKALDFRILGLHLERLSDIALTSPERGHDLPLSFMRPLEGGIELRNVCFRYAETERFVLEDVNLRIEPGQFVTITGPSGGGKTTLVKLMLGLLEPTSGEILVDGLPLSTMGPRTFREQVAAVMQEDQLLSGSIADNICFFDAQFDEERMLRSAKRAAIHEDIMAMPMTYSSLIGDMGNSLSGGQKQRVLLARALYRDPQILFLDEGTAHLDVKTERAINESLRQLQMTRVSVAHRPDISSGADMIVAVAHTIVSITDGRNLLTKQEAELTRHIRPSLANSWAPQKATRVPAEVEG
ncbi:MAG: peptidase domain-containing ABC transporter [Xanthobacteraceae bacterium]